MSLFGTPESEYLKSKASSESKCHSLFISVLEAGGLFQDASFRNFGQLLSHDDV